MQSQGNRRKTGKMEEAHKISIKIREERREEVQNLFARFIRGSSAAVWGDLEVIKVYWE